MFLIDQSAWIRIHTADLPDDRIAWLAERFEHHAIGACLPFLLEAGYSARSGRDHIELVDDLAQLPRVPISDEVEQAALRAQRDLALAGHHRLPPTDLIIAACAHTAGTGVLHYDRDYDLIREHTSLRFDSEWLMPSGTL